MHEELVKRLRTTKVTVYKAEDVNLLQEAADAVEELTTEVEALKHDIERYIQINTDLLNEPKWIPVTERLPDTDGDYLVWFYDARCWKVAEYSKHTAKERHVWWFAGIDRTKFVTHWIPLPAPPKEEPT